MIEDPEFRKEYLERLTAVLKKCLEEEPKTHHALLIVANDNSETLSLYSINATEPELLPLVKAAHKVVEAQVAPDAFATIN